LKGRDTALDRFKQRSTNRRFTHGRPQRNHTVGRTTGRGQQHTIDHVNHAVGGVDVGLDQTRVVDVGSRFGQRDLDRRAGNRRGGFDPQRVFAVHATRRDVILQNLRQLVLVFGLQQLRDGSLGQCAEGFFGEVNESPVAIRSGKQKRVRDDMVVDS